MSTRNKPTVARKIKVPRQREIVCEKCKHHFMSSLLGVAYCPNCKHPNKLEPGFSPTR